MDSWPVQKRAERILISCLRGDLPPSCSTSFFMDATGGYPGGVWYSPFLYVTARPATKAPVTALYLRGRRCTAAPNVTRTDQHARTATSVAPGTPLRASLALTDCQDGVANGAGPSECTAGVTPASEREPGTGRLRREQAPVPCTPAMASDHRQSREHATTQRPGPHEDPLTASSGRPSERG